MTHANRIMKEGTAKKKQNDPKETKYKNYNVF